MDNYEIKPESDFLSSNKGKFIIGLLLIIAALTYFGFIAFKGATVYYLTVGELTNQDVTEEAKMVRVSGKLVANSYLRDRASGIAYFDITDGANTMPARYQGSLPDLFFNEHSEIILEGRYAGTTGFDSSNIIVKCPSKYIAEDEQATY